MGFFKNMFKGSEPKEEKTLAWNALNELEQIDKIKERSKAKPQLIFKHSTRCGISRMVLNQFIANYELEESDVDLYFLDLLSYREVSNEVGYNFQVLHASPQLLVIKDGVAVSHASHGAINAMDMNAFKI